MAFEKIPAALGFFLCQYVLEECHDKTTHYRDRKIIIPR